MKLRFVTGPTESPTINKVTVLSSTSVQVLWEPVPEQFRHGIITKYTIHYKDDSKNEESNMTVNAAAVNATINALRQGAEYTFWMFAATSKGNSPKSNTKTAATDGKENIKICLIAMRRFWAIPRMILCNVSSFLHRHSFGSSSNLSSPTLGTMFAWGQGPVSRKTR